MTATVALCILSTIAFCLCTRGVIASTSSRVPPRLIEGSSAQAKRIARAYLVFALVVLAVVAFAGATFSYVELFSSI